MALPGYRRVFIAIPIGWLDGLEWASKVLAAQFPNIRLTSYRDWHLTIRFLGDLTQSQFETVHEDLSQTVSMFRQFRLKLHGIGGFPEDLNAKVVWAGVQEHPVLHELAAALEQALGDIGHSSESRHFRPHVTLGRSRLGVNLTDSELSSRPAMCDFGEIKVPEIGLYRSELQPTGAKYQVLSRYRFRES